jgi:hypothetical protein
MFRPVSKGPIRRTRAGWGAIAAVILIRPLLKANEGRTRNVHVVVFFIILVANIGGALSPLGEPLLFVGFLHSVEFSGRCGICGFRH